MDAPSPGRDELADSLLAAARALMAMAIRTIGQGAVPLTEVQHRVLLLLEAAGTLSVNQVAERLGVDQSNASRHCTRLAELGLVQRTPAARDRRAVDLRLTEAGHGQVLEVRSARRRWAADVLARLSDEEARAAVRGLEMFATAAEETDKESQVESRRSFSRARPSD
ncbi:MAG TPA: MarR family transcriptional regulator [Nocardioides sp.]|uniref:MarR family winged helix-turn-helix transcriptional regulator n=1 Tax=Nocardioides sp. TaxID=35761 RepID=UPI002F3FDF0D